MRLYGLHWCLQMCRAMRVDGLCNPIKRAWPLAAAGADSEWRPLVGHKPESISRQKEKVQCRWLNLSNIHFVLRVGEVAS